MSYFIPQKHKCPKCGAECEYADNGQVASVPIVNGRPVCPNCWNRFVMSKVPIMEVMERGE